MTQYAGKFSFRIGGQLIETLDGAKLDNPLGESRKGVKGVRGFGWTRDSEIPTATGDIPVRSDLQLADLWALTDQPVTFEGDDGTIWLMPSATMSKASMSTGGDVSKYSVEIINTGPCTQLT